MPPAAASTTTSPASTTIDVVAEAADQAVVAGAADQAVVAGVADQRVVAGESVEGVVAGGADEAVGQALPVPAERRGAGVGEVLDVSRSGCSWRARCRRGRCPSPAASVTTSSRLSTR
jgi:hypothetical protein